MNGSPTALKLTLGRGGMGVLALILLSSNKKPHVPLGLAFSVAMLSTFAFLLARADFLRANSVPTLQALAALWYLLVATVAMLMAAWRGFVGNDVVFIGMMMLGAWPCVTMVRARRR